MNMCIGYVGIGCEWELFGSRSELLLHILLLSVVVIFVVVVEFIG